MNIASSRANVNTTINPRAFFRLLTTALSIATVSPFALSPRIVSRGGRPISRMASTTPRISDADRYLFDLNGYVVVKNVFTKAQIASANAITTEHISEARERIDDSVRNTIKGSPLAGDGTNGRIDLGGVLAWDDERAGLFRSVLDNEKLVPYYHELLGAGYRMDHMPFIIAQNKGSEGFSLHGGVIDVASGDYNHYLQYSCTNGIIRNNLLACSVVMADHSKGAGGFCVVRGSHKSNFKAPADMINGVDHKEFVYQPETEAGDVILFSEGTVHGALPWNQDYQRRVCLYRFAPSTCSYGRSYLEDPTSTFGSTGGWPATIYAHGRLTETQKAVLLPPYANRLDRVVLDGKGGTEVSSRSKEKKLFDKEVFGSTYF